MVAVVLALLAAMPVAQADQGSSGADQAPTDLPDVAQPQIDDPISNAELEDLQAIADQKSMSLEAAIDRYAWNDNFALALALIRAAHPEAIAGAEIIDGEGAWVAFAASAPGEAITIIEAFEKAHPTVTVDVRPDTGFTEIEIEKAIESIHYAVFEAAKVLDATTAFDFDTRQITSVASLFSGVSDTALDELRAEAIDRVVASGLGGLLDNIEVSVVRSNLPVLGGIEDSNAQIGGEILTTCTSGFVVTHPVTYLRGPSTAGHCPDSQTDDGDALTYRAGYEGTHGDFEWHTGPDIDPDDFYAGDANNTEVARRDVAGVGAPVVGQALCRNGMVSHKDCLEVMTVNVCHYSICNLVQMDAHLSTYGDSGGPWYWNFTAYGIHYGFRYDPFFPWERELFSRGDRIDNALGVNIATT